MQPLFITGYVVHHPAHDLFIHPVLPGVIKYNKVTKKKINPKSA